MLAIQAASSQLLPGGSISVATFSSRGGEGGFAVCTVACGLALIGAVFQAVDGAEPVAPRADRQRPHELGVLRLDVDARALAAAAAEARPVRREAPAGAQIEDALPRASAALAGRALTF